MNNLGNKIISPNIMEEQEIVEQLKSFLNKYLSEKEVYSQIYEKSNIEEIEINYQIEEKNGTISVSPTIDYEKYKKEFDELKEISTLRDLKRFVIKYQDILIENILKEKPNFDFSCINTNENSLENNELFIEDLIKLTFGKEQKSKLENKYSKEVKETYNRIGDKIIDKLNQDKIENLEEKLKENNIILGETIDIKNYKRIIEIAKQDERILELFKINPKFTIKILEKLEKKEIDIKFIDIFDYNISEILDTKELQENIFDFYNNLGIDFLINSYTHLSKGLFKNLLENKDVQRFIKDLQLNQAIEGLEINGYSIDIWFYISNLLQLDNIDAYLYLTRLYSKEYLFNSFYYLLNYYELTNEYLNLDDLWTRVSIFTTDPTNEKVKYFLKGDNHKFYDMINNHNLRFSNYLEGKYKKFLGLGRELTPEEFYDKYIKVNAS